jgi:hypothetical protein
MHRFAAVIVILGLVGCDEPRPSPAPKAPAPPAPAKVAPAPTPPPAPAKVAPAAAPAAAPAGKVVATWVLDRPAMAKVYDAEVAKLPPKDRPMAKAASETMKLTEMKLTLYEGDKGELTTTRPRLDKGAAPVVEKEPLTWQRKGKTLTLTGPRQLKRPMTCTGKASLACSQEGAPTKLLFTKP